MAIAWYFKKDGREHGPVGSDDLRMLASMGMLHPTDLVRKAGMTRWAPASALKGLFRTRSGPSLPAPTAQPNPQISPADNTEVHSPYPARKSKPKSSTALPGWIWYLTATAALCAVAAFVYRFAIEPGQSTTVAHSEPANPMPTTDPILARDVADPLLIAISSDNPFDRGMALRQVRASVVSPAIRPQVHQIVCDTLDDRAFSSIWSSAARALGEIGSADDLPRLKPLIDKAPIETQCSAMAAAMVLSPEAGTRYFEPRAADEKYGAITTGYLAEWGARSEPAALAMLKSPERMCRSHALFLLKAFGTSHAIDSIAKARETEKDKAIAEGYQFTIDAINSRNQ